MIRVKCIEKLRDKQNRIYGYRIQDTAGRIQEVNSEILKRVIANKQIEVINLKLTSDNRLVDKDVEILKKPQISEEKVKAALVKAKFIGVSAPEALYTLACQEGFQDIIELSETNCKYERAELNTHFKNYIDAIKHPEATIFVTNMSGMFHGCTAKFINLSNFNNSNVLDLSNFNTSNVTDMSDMFGYCTAQTLDLSSFNTSKVTNMRYMFKNCEVETLDLSSFNTSNVTNMYGMFEQCKAEILNLSSFDTSNVIRMDNMFYECEAQTLDLNSFNTSNIIDMSHMFWGCKAKTIDLISFDTSNVINMFSVFRDCAAEIKATDPRILEAYKNR